jgi:hypothetical protein
MSIAFGSLVSAYVSLSRGQASNTPPPGSGVNWLGQAPAAAEL